MDTKIFGALVLAAGALYGCAVEQRPLEIAVTEAGFSVGGQQLKTRAELAGAIRKSGATECRVVPSVTAPYRQVETAVLALQDSGCSSGIIGNEQP